MNTIAKNGDVQPEKVSRRVTTTAQSRRRDDIPSEDREKRCQITIDLTQQLDHLQPIGRREPDR
jgi:hypothetical protein